MSLKQQIMRFDDTRSAPKSPQELKALPDDVRWTGATQKARDAAKKKSAFVESIILPLLDAEGTVSKAADRIIDEKFLFGSKNLSRATIYNWLSAYKKNGLSGLLPAHRGRIEKRYEWEPAALNLYNRPGCPSYSAVARILREVNGYNDATPDAIRTFLTKKVPAGIGKLSQARIGKKTYRLNQTHYIRRTTENLAAGDLWQGDGHRLDIYLSHPVTGKIFRPELIVWMDIRSRYIAGWGLAENENAVESLNVFTAAIRKWKHVPPILYLDNGSGYKAKILANEDWGAYRRLGVQDVIFAIPGNARAKGNIEKFFDKMERDLNVFLVGFCGTGCSKEIASKFVVESNKNFERRPETQPMSVEQWKKMFTGWLDRYHARPHPEFPDETPKSCWQKLVAVDPVFNIEQMQRPHEPRKVSRGTVLHQNREYTSRHLLNYNYRQVLVEYDMHNDTQVIIRDESGRFLCTAQIVKRRDYISASRLKDAKDKSVRGKLARIKQKKTEIIAQNALSVDAGQVIAKLPKIEDKIEDKSEDQTKIKIDLNDI